MPKEQIALADKYLTERGLSMDTPIGIINFHGSYDKAREQVSKFMSGETQEMGFLSPPTDFTKPIKQPEIVPKV